MGGTVSSTINPSLNMLLTTQKEYDSRTQKIKDALRCHLPVVKEEYLHDCEKEGKRLPVTAYLLNEFKEHNASATAIPLVSFFTSRHTMSLF